jgi:hypothetical protein
MYILGTYFQKRTQDGPKMVQKRYRFKKRTMVLIGEEVHFSSFKSAQNPLNLQKK